MENAIVFFEPEDLASIMSSGYGLTPNEVKNYTDNVTMWINEHGLKAIDGFHVRTYGYAAALVREYAAYIRAERNPDY